MTTLTQLDYSALYSDAANDRLATLGQRRWGQGGMLAPMKFSFEGGMPDPSTYPMEGIIEATRHICMTDRMALNYGGIMGFDGMRDAVVRLESIHGGNVPTRDNVLITSGASQALHLIYSTFLSPGDTMMLEEQSYIAQQIRMYHPKLETVPLDEHGPRTDVMRQTLEAVAAKGVRPKLFYSVTGFHNPTGIRFTRERLQQILDLSKEFGFIILEDDPYSRIRFTDADTPSLYSMDTTGSHVIRVGTVSKILGAGMRIGWAIASPEVLRALSQFKQDGGTNPFAQRVAAEFWREHLWSHIDTVTASYKRKRDTMLKAMAEHCKGLSEWNAPEGGIFLWVKLHEDVDDDKLMDRAAQEGVLYRPGMAFSSNGGGKGYIRLAYSFQDPETIEEGIMRLGRAMHAAAD